jgi:DNA-directed RNA polymerase specialized sigma24 family protein
MPTSRTIPPETWEHARRALVFYFSRHLVQYAEDLAQETLMALWRRDYTFGKNEEFLLVCHGFARKVLMAARRQHRELVPTELPMELGPSGRNVFGMSGGELAVFLDQVIDAGENQLGESDWILIRREIEPGETAAHTQNNPNLRRVQLHRARRRLARMMGWDPKP